MKRRHEFTERFRKKLARLDRSLLQHVEKQIDKIIDNPTIGKPMRYARKGTREVYLDSFRLSYLYDSAHNVVVFDAIYHKKKQ